MKIFSRLLLPLIGLCFFSGCSVSVNQANGNSAPPVNSKTPPAATPAATGAGARWSVVVCTSRAKTVTLAAGPAANDSEVFATWKAGSAQRVFDLPARVQNLTQIYFKASGSEKNQVETCVLYDGKPKKRVEFDDQEDDVVSATDTDETDRCRCVN
ncbi:MAG: hypothetical protein JSS81_06235 [Acidobacteria bacterium]|nr:hypothetical protein [Acidobacteriota bacterium]